MIVKYYIPDHGETPQDAVELPKNYIGYTWRYMAEVAAQDHHDGHGGWESTWPITFVLLNEKDQEMGRFEVERESVPQFHATEV